MNVVAVEVGDRPSIFSKARRYAPRGVKRLGELLGEMDFADNGFVTLDWTNSLKLQPDEASIPVVIIRASKRVPAIVSPDNLCTVEVRLDVEDLFGNDNITASILMDIVQSMGDSMRDAIEKRLRY